MLFCPTAYRLQLQATKFCAAAFPTVIRSEKLNSRMAEVYRPKRRRHNVHYIIAKAFFRRTYSNCDVSNQSPREYILFPAVPFQNRQLCSWLSDRKNCTLTIIIMSELCTFSSAQAITISLVVTSNWVGYICLLVNNICLDQK